jgi:cytochrome c6
MKSVIRGLITGAVLASGATIAAASGAEASAKIIPISRLAAEELWKAECASCHGPDGRSDTRAGKRVRAPDMTTPEFHAALPEGRAFKSLKEGIVDEKGSRRKKAFGEELSDEQIQGLVEYLREFNPEHPNAKAKAAE